MTVVIRRRRGVASVGRSVRVVIVVLVVVGLLASCSVTISETPKPSAPDPTAAATSSRSASPSAPATAPAGGTSRCPEPQFDASASLGPAFDNDIFMRDESRNIGRAFLADLTRIYAGDLGVDVCKVFTGSGWMEAVAWDPRLAQVDQGRLVERSATLRVAFELGSYDLRLRPPRIPLDLIFDAIPAGVAANASGDDRGIAAAAERVGMRVEMVFDGHQWRAEGVGEIDPSNRWLLDLPAEPTDRPACREFRRDQAGSPFDEDADRPWCDLGGDGLTVLQPEQLAFFTRYPCEQGQAAVLTVGRPLGYTLDPLVRWDYVRDPTGAFLRESWIEEPFDGSAGLPDDAVDTGWTNGNIDLWIRPSELDGAIYVVRGDTVERWPRAVPMWGVIDCN